MSIEIENLLHALNLDRPDIAELPEGAVLACNITTLRKVAAYLRNQINDQPDELACLKAAEESLFHHGYNPATNRDVARICFTAMRSQLKREIVSLDKCAEAVKQVFDLSLEGPDAGFKPDDIAEAVLKAAGAQWRRGTDAE